ncbi:MAG: queuosine salvage family protein [Pseudomonadota bacterium]
MAEKGRHVRIDRQALRRFARSLIHDEVSVPPWDDVYHFYDGGPETVSYLLVLDSLNFCFWPASGEKRWEIEYQSRRLSGYYALAASLKRAVEKGFPITKADYLAEISLSDLKGILGGSGDLPLLNRRHEILKELGTVLLRDYAGEARYLVEAAKGSAIRLVRLLADRLLSFRDGATYHGLNVFFYKRAQIFAADLHAAFQGKGWGLFRDMDELTAFADYKVPQVLRHLGILLYGSDLAQKIDQRILIGAGSPEEVEIRANNIWAIELIKRELSGMGKELRSFEIDWILWNRGQNPEFKEKPFHRTVTIFY